MNETLKQDASTVALERVGPERHAPEYPAELQVSLTERGEDYSAHDRESAGRPQRPAQAYRTIVIDPPWPEYGGGRIKRGADRHYTLLEFTQIIETIKTCPKFRPDPDGCHLYLWVTNNHLRYGLALMESVGFRYVTNLVWVKPSFGIGQYFRGRHEILLFGVKGNLRTRNYAHTDTDTVILAPKRDHSQKPEEAYALIEKESFPPRLEMFARSERMGWVTWGDGVGSSRTIIEATKESSGPPAPKDEQGGDAINGDMKP